MRIWKFYLHGQAFHVNVCEVYSEEKETEALGPFEEAKVKEAVFFFRYHDVHTTSTENECFWKHATEIVEER